MHCNNILTNQLCQNKECYLFENPSFKPWGYTVLIAFSMSEDIVLILSKGSEKITISKLNNTISKDFENGMRTMYPQGSSERLG